MEEAVGDVALDPNPPPSECVTQPGVQEDILTDNRDQIQLPTGAQPDNAWHCSPSRAERIEALRLCIASGTYQVDTTELAVCILHNATHLLEVC
jgi:anti-sigma28 factor (negative regulator of flagellin synthesis)